MADPQTSLTSQLNQLAFPNNTAKHTQLQCDKICPVKNNLRLNCCVTKDCNCCNSFPVFFFFCTSANHG